MKAAAVLAVLILALSATADAITIEKLTELAEQGDALSQIALGIHYEIGEGVPQNFAESVKWYRTRCERALSPARQSTARKLSASPTTRGTRASP